MQRQFPGIDVKLEQLEFGTLLEDSSSGDFEALLGRYTYLYDVSSLGQVGPKADLDFTGYVRDIYRKLGISSRAEATLEAARRGLVA